MGPIADFGVVIGILIMFRAGSASIGGSWLCAAGNRGGSPQRRHFSLCIFSLCVGRGRRPPGVPCARLLQRGARMVTKLRIRNHQQPAPPDIFTLIELAALEGGSTTPPPPPPHASCFY